MKEQLAISSQQSAISDEQLVAADSIQNPKSKIQNDGEALPASRKVYVEGVPFREIALSPSRAMDGSLEENAPVRVYDTSGVWTDPDTKCDVREGLPDHRRDWIIARGDVEEYTGREVLPQDNGYLTKGAEDVARVKDRGALEQFRASNEHRFVQSRAHASRRCTTRGRVSSPPEMEYVAIRENLGRKFRASLLSSHTSEGASAGFSSTPSEGGGGSRFG
jgi:phosphomethylpyrimidine synthase